MSYEAIRDRYLANEERARAGSHRQYSRLSLEEAIVQATDTMELRADGFKVKDEHKRYSRETLGKCRRALLAAQQTLRTVEDFDILLRVVQRIIRDAGIRGVGQLGLYDFATKIGAVLNVAPKDRIYVHRKPLETAQAMRLAIHKSPDGFEYVMRNDLPEAFREMPADAVENMFCNYGRDFRDFAVRHGARLL